MNTADAIIRTLESPNVADTNFENANVVDMLHKVSVAGFGIANAITPRGCADGNDATGGRVGSLTEAAMGITAGLVRIADAISDLADATRNRSNS